LACENSNGEATLNCFVTPKGHMHQCGSKLIQDQRVFNQKNYYTNQYK